MVVPFKVDNTLCFVNKENVIKIVRIRNVVEVLSSYALDLK